MLAQPEVPHQGASSWCYPGAASRAAAVGMSPWARESQGDRVANYREVRAPQPSLGYEEDDIGKPGGRLWESAGAISAPGAPLPLRSQGLKTYGSSPFLHNRPDLRKAGWEGARSELMKRRGLSGMYI